LHGRFNDCHQLALQQVVVPFGLLPQPLHHIVPHIPGREVDGHGSKSAPGRMEPYHKF